VLLQVGLRCPKRNVLLDKWREVDGIFLDRSQSKRLGRIGWLGARCRYKEKAQ